MSSDEFPSSFRSPSPFPHSSPLIFSTLCTLFVSFTSPVLLLCLYCSLFILCFPPLFLFSSVFHHHSLSFTCSLNLFSLFFFFPIRLLPRAQCTWWVTSATPCVHTDVCVWSWDTHINQHKQCLIPSTPSVSSYVFFHTHSVSALSQINWGPISCRPFIIGIKKIRLITH